MSLITKIARLNHPGVLRDFTWPADLPTFGRFNLIYGWNGSGKTTLSRVFRALEHRLEYADDEVTLDITGQHVAGQDFPNAMVPVRVFNRDFVNETVFPVGGGDVPPIFVVGKESVEKQKKVERLKAEREQKQQHLSHARQEHKRAGQELEKHCINRAKLIKDTLQRSGSAYNNYNKTDYQKRAQRMATEGDAASYQLTESQRNGLLAQHQATPKPKVPEVSYRFLDLQRLADEVAALMEATVVSAAIQALKDDSSLSEWVRHGMGLHKERSSAKCLFCEQPLPAGRLSELEAHFNAEYEGLLRRIDAQLQTLEAARKQAVELRLPNRAELYEDLAGDYDAAEQAFRQTLDAAEKYLGVLVDALKRKRSDPFRALAINEATPAIDAAAIDKLNEVIVQHNIACDDFDRRTADARERLALDLIVHDLDEYSRLATAVKEASDAIGPLEKEVKQLTGEIERLEREIVEHREPAEELNEDLRNYLGHDELKLQVKETGYQLLRHGQPAEALSEGERTALALLYFLKSLRDRRFDLRHGVVVLDDPVSSLDANALYLAFGFIRHRTQDAGQLFVLTHNFAFFRQVRNWFHHQKGQNKKDINKRPARFYMLERVHEANPRRTTLRALDPLLEQYESEYHYLFACVHRAANETGDTDLEQNYSLPNVARRLLEMFLAFRRPQIAGELWQKLKDVEFDEAKKVRIARFVHTHSHGDTVGEPEHDPSLLGEARAVLADLLELIKLEDAQHFKAMVRLFSDSAVEEDAE